MSGEVNKNSLIQNNAYLKDAFSSCKYASSPKSEWFTDKKTYSIGDDSSVKIEAKDLEDYRSFFSGVDFEKMLEDGNLTSFEYDEDNDGNFEFSLNQTSENTYEISVDEESDGNADVKMEYIDGVLRSKTEFDEDGRILSYLTYDENGELDSVGDQLVNGLSAAFTNVLYDTVTDYLDDMSNI